VCIFVNDACNAEVIDDLARHGTTLIATRSAGYNQIDLAAAAQHGVTGGAGAGLFAQRRFGIHPGLMLTLGRKTHKAYNRSREFNFEIAGLEGFELRDKTVGVFGTGKIGQMVIRNLSGFGCRILAYDKYPNEEVKKYATYVDGPTFARESDIITLHCPLTPETHHILNEETLPYLKDGVFIVNTSRGALLDTAKVIKFLKTVRSAMLAIDVYEEEADYFLQRLVR
jgi:D-lactate dehydrogenase